jgi:phage-related protein
MAREYNVVANFVARTQSMVNGFNETRQGAQETVNKIDKSFSGLKGTFMKVAGFIGAAFAVDKLKDFTVGMVETTANIQALQGQYEQVMGGMKGTTDKYIDEMSKKWNKHPIELRNAMMQYMAILKGKGLSEQEAFETSKKYMDMTVDGNAFANESMADSIGRTMGIIKGEYDSADTIMINFSQTLLNDKAVKEYGKKWENLTVAQQENIKTTEALRQQNSAGVFGQAAREADSYQNNLAMLKNKYSELLAKYGSPALALANKGLSKLSDIVSGINVDTVMQKFGLVKSWILSMLPMVGNLKTVFQNLQPILVTVGGAIAVGFQKFTSILPTILNNVTGILAKFSEWSGFIPVLTGLIAAFVTYQGLIKAITIFETAYQAIQKTSLLLYNAQRAAVIAYGIAGGGLQGILAAMRASMVAMNLTMLANPIVLIIAAIVGLGVALVVAYKKSETFRNIVNGVWASLKDGFSAVINWFTVNLPQWFSNIGKWFVKFKDDTILVFSNIWSSISSGAQSFFSFIMAILQPFITFFVNSWQNLKLLVLSIVTGFFSLLTGDFEGLKLALLGIITSFKNQFENYWILLKNTVLKVALNLWNGLKSGFATGKDFVIKTAVNLYNGVINWFKSIYNGTVNLVGSIKNGIINGFTNAKDFAVNAMSNLYNGVVNWIKNIPSKISEMANSITKTVKEINLYSIGSNIVQGLIDGIGSMINKVKDKVKEVASSVKDKLKDVLGIHSPSRVMMELGNYIGQGLANGIEGAKSLVSDASQSLTEASNFANNFSVSSINPTPQTANSVNSTVLQPEKPKVIDQSRTYNFSNLTIKSDNAQDFFNNLDMYVRMNKA